MGHDHHHHHHWPDLLQPTVYVLQTGVDLARVQSADEVSAALGAFVTAFLRDLEASGCRLVGHIKGALESAAGGCLYFNATSFSGGVTIAGALAGETAACHITLNAIVYAIEHHEVERAALAALERCMGRGGA